MLWELSTPFVFMRWLLHSLGRQHTKLYLANGVAMIVVFLLCRNILGIGAVLHLAILMALALSASALLGHRVQSRCAAAEYSTSSPVD